MKTGGKKEPFIYIKPTLTIDQRGEVDTGGESFWQGGARREITTVSRLLGVCGRVCGGTQES